MEKNITITLEKAKEWYNSDNESLKEIALQAFDKDELTCNFKNITTFKKACETLGLDYDSINCKAIYIAETSKASAAMFTLNIIRKALNLGYDLHLTKNPENSYIYYPYNVFTTKDSTYYKHEIKLDKIKIIGRIKSEGEEYYVYSGHAYSNGHVGLGNFEPYYGVGHIGDNIGFLGCANKEIAQHFGKYFGMLITEAKYGDLSDFEIIKSKY